MSKSESLKEISVKTPKLNLIDLNLPKNLWFNFFTNFFDIIVKFKYIIETKSFYIRYNAKRLNIGHG